MPQGAPANASTGRRRGIVLGPFLLLEIAFYQKRSGLLIAKLPFQRVVQEITLDPDWQEGHSVPKQCYPGFTGGARRVFGGPFRGHSVGGHSWEACHCVAS